MMKRLLILSLGLLMLTPSLYAKVVDYGITRGKFHRGGYLKVEAKFEQNNKEIVKIHVKYKVDPKRLIPVPRKYLKGTHVQVLPEEFLHEYAYLKLEDTKSRKIKDAKVFHKGRVTIGRYKDCHKILIKPNNGKSTIVAYYHPNVDVAGWVKVNLTINKVPAIGSYSLTANVK
jgi:hypothetical protein